MFQIQTPDRIVGCVRDRQSIGPEKLRAHGRCIGHAPTRSEDTEIEQRLKLQAVYRYF